MQKLESAKIFLHSRVSLSIQIPFWDWESKQSYDIGSRHIVLPGESSTFWQAIVPTVLQIFDALSINLHSPDMAESSQT